MFRARSIFQLFNDTLKKRPLSSFANARQESQSQATRPSVFSGSAWYTWAFITWVPVFVFLHEHVYDLMWVRGPSMAPALSPDFHATGRRDVVGVNMWDAKANLERGMIVAFRSPRNPERIALKRIIGLEGDIVMARNRYPFPRETVPQGHVWVEGADQARSLDSNDYGPIYQEYQERKGGAQALTCLITGQVTRILWPPSRMGKISNDRSWRRRVLSIGIPPGFVHD
ncbi:LexA/Signal peptidase [Xylona heveae TC161]|uniref:Mitochondrial inner membrane protease subunit 2 n=1 Tax=Xylona heveae (strain CBS 132557 / TC161) TaxID=1328760 RepID=A0A165HDE0_XYLHT|nr:LexA/Signal peptidase [Xylona heveae TC161]KZF23339.1 LexA/Signal peptidase [Xylona heveae TC161]